MLVLPALIIVGFLLSFVLFGICMLVASIVGGASTALLVKNKAAKRLLFIGFSLVSFIGLVCLFPFVALYMTISGTVFTVAYSAAFVCIALLAIAGTYYANALQNKVVKVILCVVFILILVLAALFAVGIPLLSAQMPTV